MRDRPWFYPFTMLKTTILIFIGAGLLAAHAEENKLETLMSIMLDFRTQIRHLVSKVSNLETRFGQYQSKLDGISSKVDGISSKTDGVDRKMESFSNDVKSLKRGFTESPFSSCTGDVITVTGTTIKYPLSGNYPPNQDCKWTVSAGNNVKVSFTKFDVECCSWDADYVEIRQNNQRVARWYDHHVPSDEPILNGEFTVHFKSNDEGSKWKSVRMNS